MTYSHGDKQVRSWPLKAYNGDGDSIEVNIEAKGSSTGFK